MCGYCSDSAGDTSSSSESACTSMKLCGGSSSFSGESLAAFLARFRLRDLLVVSFFGLAASFASASLTASPAPTDSSALFVRGVSSSSALGTEALSVPLGSEATLTSSSASAASNNFCSHFMESSSALGPEVSSTPAATGCASPASADSSSPSMANPSCTSPASAESSDLVAFFMAFSPALSTATSSMAAASWSPCSLAGAMASSVVCAAAAGCGSFMDVVASSALCSEALSMAVIDCGNGASPASTV
mmetsp:Transcript_30242/g.70311  ORF Transcript_30242/g.70311 Transcript_30242/m.70311 type:complete len:248 (-) Transcript_30242:531-1274(-)